MFKAGAYKFGAAQMSPPLGSLTHLHVGKVPLFWGLTQHIVRFIIIAFITYLGFIPLLATSEGSELNVRYSVLFILASPVFGSINKHSLSE